MSARRVISTHWLRRTARAAQQHYQWLQQTAAAPTLLSSNAQRQATAACKSLGITPESQLSVERAFHERAKWRVVAR